MSNQPIAANQESLLTTVRRCAWAGLKWGNIVASIGAGIMLLAVAAVALYGAFRVGLAAVYDIRLLQAIGGIVGFYITTCAWGAIIGAIAGGVAQYVRRIRATP